jgi:hypothetical protein
VSGRVLADTSEVRGKNQGNKPALRGVEREENKGTSEGKKSKKDNRLHVTREAMNKRE